MTICCTWLTPFFQSAVNDSELESDSSFEAWDFTNWLMNFIRFLSKGVFSFWLLWPVLPPFLFQHSPLCCLPQVLHVDLLASNTFGVPLLWRLVPLPWTLLASSLMLFALAASALISGLNLRWVSMVFKNDCSYVFQSTPNNFYGMLLIMECRESHAFPPLSIVLLLHCVLRERHLGRATCSY